MACFQIKTDKNNISYLQKILEGYENIAFVAPLDPKAGLLLIQTTEDMAKDVLNALKSLDIPIYYI